MYPVAQGSCVIWHINKWNERTDDSSHGIGDSLTIKFEETGQKYTFNRGVLVRLNGP